MQKHKEERLDHAPRKPTMKVIAIKLEDWEYARIRVASMKAQFTWRYERVVDTGIVNIMGHFDEQPEPLYMMAQKLTQIFEKTVSINRLTMVR